jgi:nicotinamide riboside transporter PnuC
MSEWISYLATVMAVYGAYLNNYRSRWCFLFWLVSNTICLCIHLAAHRSGARGMKAMAARDIIFIALAVHGYLKWSGKF